MRALLASFISLRSVRLVAALWVLSTVLVLVMARNGLPFDRPLVEGASPGFELFNSWGNLLVALILMGVTYLVTRGRRIPDMSSRAPARSVALTETLGLVVYGVTVQILGLLLGDTLTGHAFSLHMHGTVYGADQPLSPTQAMLWATYNFAFYAVVPYLFFRSRGYTSEQLNLKSSNKANDTLLIVVILVLESAIELSLVSGAIFELDANQLLVGMPASFVLNLFGTVLPIMIFIYCILLPRFLKLTGSVAATIVLGGLAYASVHLFESWAVYDTPANAVLSVIFLSFQYFGPGMVKSVLTLRTGNAWVHALSYHAIDPHITLDTTNIVNVFKIR